VHRGAVLLRSCFFLGLHRGAMRLLLVSVGSLLLLSVSWLFIGSARASLSPTGALSLLARMTTLNALLFFTLGTWLVGRGFSDGASLTLLEDLLGRGSRGRREVSRADDLAWLLLFAGLLGIGPLLFGLCLLGSGAVGPQTAGAATMASLLAALVILPVVVGLVALLRWSSSPRLVWFLALVLPELLRLVLPGSLSLFWLASELGAMVLRLGAGV